MKDKIVPVKTIREDLSDAAREHLVPIATQLSSLEVEFRRFLDYQAREKGLPKPLDGWQFGIDPKTGKAYMTGSVPDAQEGK